MKFKDRAQAGALLAERLAALQGRHDVLVLALPRGGVPVGDEVAAFLHVPLDVFVVRKLGLPGQPELAMGAIATGGVRVLNREVVDALGIDGSIVDAVAADEQRELERRERQYRGDEPPPVVAGRTVVLVDDGLATGSTMRAAIAAVRQQHPATVVVAVPVAPATTCRQLAVEADDVVCVVSPEQFSAVGLWYEDFSQTSDDEVRALLARARDRHRAERESTRQAGAADRK